MDEQSFNALRKELRDFKTETEDRLTRLEAGVQVTSITNVATAAPVAAAVTEPEQPKTAAEILAMAADNSVRFMSFKGEAAKLLGSDLPAKKADIVAILEELATKPDGDSDGNEEPEEGAGTED